jgi:hypothetical protein
MKRYPALLLVGFVALSGARIAAQQPQPAPPARPAAPRSTVPPAPAAPPAAPRPVPTSNVQVDISVTDQTATPRTLSYLMCACGPGSRNSIRSSGKTEEERSLNVDSSAELVNDKILLMLSITRNPTGEGPLGINQNSATVLLESGKSKVILNAAAPNGQKLTIEVKATIIK